MISGQLMHPRVGCHCRAAERNRNAQLSVTEKRTTGEVTASGGKSRNPFSIFIQLSNAFPIFCVFCFSHFTSLFSLPAPVLTFSQPKPLSTDKKHYFLHLNGSLISATLTNRPVRIRCERVSESARSRASVCVCLSGWR